MSIQRRCVFGLALAAMALVGSRADAGLIASDSFNDPPNVPLLGQGGGTGFSDNWHAGGFNASNHLNYTTAPGSLPYPGLATSGNHVTTGPLNAIGGLSRDFTAPLGTPGTTDYFSFLIRPEGTLNQGVFNGFFGLYLNSSLGNDVFVGKPGNGLIGNYDVENRGGTLQHDSGVAAVVGQTVLLVLRADFSSGVDKFTLYVNPTPGGLEPSLGTVKQDTDIGSVTGLSLYSTGAYSLDEIRVGTTFGDVVPAVAVPEPASLVLVAMGGLVALGASRRSRRIRRPSTPA